MSAEYRLPLLVKSGPPAAGPLT